MTEKPIRTWLLHQQMENGYHTCTRNVSTEHRWVAVHTCTEFEEICKNLINLRLDSRTSLSNAVLMHMRVHN